MITLTVIGFLAAALAASAVWNVRLLGEVQRLTEPGHTRPVNGRLLGTLPRLTEQTVPVTETDDAPPWKTRTAAQPVLAEDEISKPFPPPPTMDELRAEYFRWQDKERNVAWTRDKLEKLGDDPTATGAQRVYDGLRAKAALEYGRAPVADVLAAEQEEQVA